jgi:predicted transcriptional regulator
VAAEHDHQLDLPVDVVGRQHHVGARTDQGALLQTALNIETNSAQQIEEMRLINKYLRAVIPFQGGRADEKA